MGLLDEKQQSNLHTQGGLSGIQTGCLGALHGDNTFLSHF